MSTTINVRHLNIHVSVLPAPNGGGDHTLPPTSLDQTTGNASRYLEVVTLGGGEKITQKQMLAELAALQGKAPTGQTWRIETPHELFTLRSRLTHKNAKGAHSADDSIEPGYYWTDEETPWYEGGRVVVGFDLGDVFSSDDGLRAFARAVLVSGQSLAL